VDFFGGRLAGWRSDDPPCLLFSFCELLCMLLIAVTESLVEGMDERTEEVMVGEMIMTLLEKW
jgi:hypothetical protein